MIKKIIEKNEKGILNENKIAILKKNFPNCFTGNSFDIEKFKKEINQEVEISSEGYNMDFLGKNYAKFIADSIDTETVLTPNEEHNSKKENLKSENIYITGDNLDVLKHLRKSYSGQVKVIYIDPPYNTGNDGFAYNDDFNFSKESLMNFLSITEEEAQRILKMTSSSSSSHSAWLTFMYPRLYIARELLMEEGVIFISIDDHEQPQLRMLCDDVFGEENFISNITNINNPKGRSDGKHIAPAHEYIMVYQKKNAKITGWLPEENILRRYNKKDIKGKKYREIDLRKTGDNDRKEDRPNLYYYFYFNQKTKDLIASIEEKEIEGYVKIFPTRRDGSLGRWRWELDTSKKNIDSLLPKYSTAGGKWMIYEIDYLDDDEKIKPTTVWNFKDVNSERGTEQFVELGFDKEVFPKPKPLGTVSRCINISTEKDSLVLDFFSGSGTTAQAVMNLNAEDEGARKYILVQIDEQVKNGSMAEKEGFKTIDEIGRERIIRAAEKLKKESNAKFDSGFKHYYAKNFIGDTIDKLKDFDPNLLASELEVEFDRATIMATWVNHDGHGLNPAIKEIDLKGYIGYSVNQHFYLLDKGLSQENIDILLSKIVEERDFNPTIIILYGYNFNDFNILSQLETNLKQLKNEEKNIEVTLVKRY